MGVDLYKGRENTIRIVFLLGALLLVGKALQLQVIDSDFQKRASGGGLEKAAIYPARGTIYDRKGRILVFNKPAYDLLVTVKQINPAMDTTKFCQLLGITKAEFRERLNKDWSTGRYSKRVPFVFASMIIPERFAALQESLYEFPGFQARLRQVRSYPHQSAAHMLGYIAEVNDREIDKYPHLYVPGDYIGKSGIEASYEELLRGIKGVQYRLKDKYGKDVGTYKNGANDSLAVPGYDLISSIDLELQAYGEQLMQNKIGAIVAIEPATGEILAMISAPGYNPNVMTIGNELTYTYTDLLKDPRKPLLDRAATGKYPPGSVFKTVVGLVGMNTGATTADRGIGCDRGLVKCHNHPYSGNIQAAVQNSCNPYFETVFLNIINKYGKDNPAGLDTFNYYLPKFGIGAKLGVDTPNETNGNFPTSKFYVDRFGRDGDKYKSYYTRSLGIGQGEMLMTNIQIANLAALIGNRGWFYTPHLVKSIRRDKERVRIDPKYRTKNKVPVNPSLYYDIIEGMERVTISGTAKSAFIAGLPICGKTGTAQNPHGKDHSVFFAFAPKDRPQIAIAVYVENSGFGGTYAAPIASLMIEKHVRDSISNSRKYLEERMFKTDLMPRIAVREVKKDTSELID